MARYILINLKRQPAARLRGLFGVLYSILVIAAGVTLFVLLWPIISAVLLVLLGAVLVLVLIGGVAAIIFGWKLRKAMRQLREQFEVHGPGGAARGGPGARPKRHVDSRQSDTDRPGDSTGQ